MQICYPTDALWRDPNSGAWSVASGFEAAGMALSIDIVAAGGEAVLRDAEGRERARGPLGIEKTVRLQRADGGELRLERIELGALSLIAASEPLQPGHNYWPVGAVPHPLLHLGPAGLAEHAALGAGAMVATVEGELPVEWLRAGDRVLTRDSGYQPLVAVARVADVAPAPLAAPFRLPADAFGPHRPQRPLLIAPSQRVLVAAPELQLWFGDSEMFARGDHLAGAYGLAPGVPETAPRMYALLCAAHEVILVDGLWLETALPTPGLLAAFDPGACANLTPALARDHAAPARNSLSDRELALLARPAVAERRHIAA